MWYDQVGTQLLLILVIEVCAHKARWSGVCSTTRDPALESMQHLGTRAHNKLHHCTMYLQNLHDITRHPSTNG
jgi:hypothetical protein